MKKVILTLAALSIVISCKSKNSSTSNNSSEEVKVEDSNPAVSPSPKPINPIPPSPEPSTKEIISKLNFGESGLVSLNNDTGEFQINTPITGEPDYNQELSKSSLYDSYVTDQYYGYKSELFPIDRYVYVQIPDIIKFDKEKTIDGSSNNDVYNVYIQIWGKAGTKSKGNAYYACYKSLNGEYSKLDFVINESDNKLNEYCTELAPKIKSGEIKVSKIKGNDFIFMKVYGFRFYSYGKCFKPETCEIFHKFNLKYFIQKN